MKTLLPTLKRKNGIVIFFFFFYFFLLFFIPFSSLFSAVAGSPYSIYFYNPETNINNYSSIKIEFDTYLSKFGSYLFQPFSEKDTFENFMEKKDAVFMLSSWHYKMLRDKFALEPILVGVLKGKSTQKRILSSKKKIADLDMLSDTSLASAGSEDFTRNILLQMMGEGKKDLVDSINILTVPKDIDALMAVGFGMAVSALTTETSYFKLETINPKQYQMLKKLATSKEILLPLVAVPKNVIKNENIDKLLKIIEEIGATEEGEKKLKMLGLNGWKKLDLLDRESLDI
ncbi:hypothetical protein ACFLQ1_01515 [Candidatus Auribacterota bacterium]